MRNKIFDCITFFDNNFMFNFRYNILKDYVDYFVICESKFDHRGNEKKINFIKYDEYDYKKIKHIVLEKPFPKNTSRVRRPVGPVRDSSGRPQCLCPGDGTRL